MLSHNIHNLLWDLVIRGTHVLLAVAQALSNSRLDVLFSTLAEWVISWQCVEFVTAKSFG